MWQQSHYKDTHVVVINIFLHVCKCEQAMRVWGHTHPPSKIFKIRHSEIASEAMFGTKKLLEL